MIWEWSTDTTKLELDLMLIQLKWWYIIRSKPYSRFLKFYVSYILISSLIVYQKKLIFCFAYLSDIFCSSDFRGIRNGIVLPVYSWVLFLNYCQKYFLCFSFCIQDTLIFHMPIKTAKANIIIHFTTRGSIVSNGYRVSSEYLINIVLGKCDNDTFWVRAAGWLLKSLIRNLGFFTSRKIQNAYFELYQRNEDI